MSAPAACTPSQDTTFVEWTLNGGAKALHTHATTLTPVIARTIARLDAGTHQLRLAGVEYIIWVDHTAATDDYGNAAPGWTYTDHDLRHVLGPDPLIHHVPVATNTTSPYRPDRDTRALTYAAEHTAAHLISHATRHAN